MNKETSEIFDYIQQSGAYLHNISNLRSKHNNFKDFNVMFSYLVMEIVNNERRFFKIKRNKIDLQTLAEFYF